MNKLLIIVCIGLLLGSGISYVAYDLDEPTEEKDGGVNLEETRFQGPVPIGHDLEHFRRTGETIKEDIN